MQTQKTAFLWGPCEVKNTLNNKLMSGPWRTNFILRSIKVEIILPKDGEFWRLPWKKAIAAAIQNQVLVY